MARLIDAGDFLKRLNERPVDYLDLGCDFYYSEETVESVLNETPTVDAVEVVRCKDCRFIIDRADGTHGCYRHFVDDCNPDDFCSYGERRTNETD